MNGHTTRWGVVLAGGSGKRLNTLTTDATGTVIPKQYCSFFGGPSLLRRAIDRLGRVVDSSRIVVVVSARHRRWWEPELSNVPAENVIVQPCDRGTACGLLLPLISILTRDPTAQIVVSPSDHYVREESTLATSLLTAQACVDSQPDYLVLLGMKPEHPDAGYGWITPSPGGENMARGIMSFVEKPDSECAERLMRSGALWSSFTFVVAGETLMNLFRHLMPWLVEKFNRRLAFSTGHNRRHALLSLYDRLPTVDFSRGVLEHAGESLHVLPVPPCGWTDLGTPQRVSECVSRYGSAGRGTDGTESAHVDLQMPSEPTLPPTHRSCPIDLADVSLR